MFEHTSAWMMFQVGFGLFTYPRTNDQQTDQQSVCVACGSANCKNCDHKSLRTIEAGVACWLNCGIPAAMTCRPSVGGAVERAMYQPQWELWDAAVIAAKKTEVLRASLVLAWWIIADARNARIHTVWGSVQA